MIYSTYPAALEAANDQLKALRRTLEDIKAVTPSAALADSIRYFKARMAAIEEAIEEAQSLAIGSRLVRLAEKLEVVDPDDVFSISELLDQSPADEKETAYAWLGRTWDGSFGADALEKRAGEEWSAHVAGGLGSRAATVIAAHYDAVAEAMRESPVSA